MMVPFGKARTLPACALKEAFALTRPENLKPHDSLDTRGIKCCTNDCLTRPPVLIKTGGLLVSVGIVGLEKPWAHGPFCLRIERNIVSLDRTLPGLPKDLRATSALLEYNRLEI